MSWILSLSNLTSLVQHSQKCLAGSHLFLPVFISLSFMQNLSLKATADPTYCNLQHWHVTKQTTLTLLQDKVPLTLQSVHVVVHLKVLSKTMKLVHTLHLLLQLLIKPTIRFFADGNDKGDKNSFQLLPLLKITLIDFPGKVILIKD